MTGIEYHRDLKEVQSDAQLGGVLDAAACAPFDRIAWFAGLEAHCGLRPLLVVARDEDGLAALPLTDALPHPQALANWYTFRFRPLLAGPSPERLLTRIARDLARKAHRVILSGIPGEDGSAALIATAFREAGWHVRSEPCDVNHVLALDGRDYAAYLAARPGQLRTTLKRKSGKVETRVLTHFDAVLWTAYEDIYAESWKPAEGSPAFLRAFAEAEGAAGRLRFGIAFVEGEPVAAQMWTVEGGTAFIHKLAHRESAKATSPGSVLSAALFRHVIDEDRVTDIDFGTGDNPYKRDWMETVRPRYRLDMLRPGHPANWPVMARRFAGDAAHSLARAAKRR
ncbi:GNAT family N-acetyltransferase [Novosphingobium sp. 9]|uniref:GNAT family N-acetyltransferase n=1 Tax=Novosphingobium sp. 9 TaxID=2025349 RepID=UPI0021B67833|nr:GNAT family N-acetyltransferase [Novosphingobium sp. 9]